MSRESLTPLGDLFEDISAGVSLPGADRAPRDGEVGILTLSAVIGTQLDIAACKAVPAALVPHLGPSVRAGTIVMSRSNTTELVGSCVYVDEDHTDRYLPDLLWQITLHPDAPCSGEWLAAYLRTVEGRRTLLRAAAGTSGTMVKLSMNRLRALKVPIPPCVVQDAVVSTSGCLDRMVRCVGSLVRAKRTYRHGLAQQLLTGQRRFPEFSSAWIKIRLGDVFTERNETSRSELPLLSVTGDRGLIRRTELSKRDSSNPDKSKYKRVTVGDIAYNTMRMWQGVSALASLEGIVSPAYTVVAPSDRIDGCFAKHLFKFPPVVHLFHRYSQGLVDDTLNLKFDRFARISLTVPSDVDEQARIALALDLCDAELELLALQQRQADLQRRGLLANLLTGEFRAPV